MKSTKRVGPIKTWSRHGICRALVLLLALCLALLVYPDAYAKETGDPVIGKILIGDASWYMGFFIAGNKFFRNGHNAAMWGVPLGTKVRVTNIDNGKSIIVTINDRGPNKRLVAKGRIIDLAAKAFYELNGNFKPSVIRVKVEILR